jgi:hypothetical protein
MTVVHTIRLRGPWGCQPVCRYERSVEGGIREAKSGLPPPFTVRLPCQWDKTAAGEFWGRIRFVRRFGQPTGLEANDRVWLVFEATDAHTMASLNGCPIGAIPPKVGSVRFEVGRLLRDGNELVLEVDRGLDPRRDAGRVWIGQVRIEIEPGGLVDSRV